MTDSATLAAEYESLIFPRFTEDTALSLGLRLVELARAEALPVVIDIRSAARTFFHVALPGSAPLNDRWATRKSATALAFQLPSLLVGARNRDKGETLQTHGLSPDTHADHGGAVPIRVAGRGRGGLRHGLGPAAGAGPPAGRARDPRPDRPGAGMTP
jgi:uncharacterized protein (UPF0303 family)